MLVYPKIIKLKDIITLKTRPGVSHTKVSIQHDNKKICGIFIISFLANPKLS